MTNNKNQDKFFNAKRMVNCPDCGKQRLAKPVDKDGVVEPVSDKFIEVRDTKRFVDACGFCQIRYSKADSKYLRDSLIKMQRSIRDTENPSDHKDFSLDI